MYIILAVLAFGLLIMIHELGHFILAKLNKVKVDEFAIGMGPQLFSIKGKETKYSLKLLPIGGYVKMYGEEEDIKDPDAFTSKSPMQRISIVAAGAVMNYLLAVFLFALIASNMGLVRPKINEVLADSPAYAAGLKPGDEITKINSKRVFTWDDFTLHVLMSEGSTVNIEYTRNGKSDVATLTPVLDSNEGRYRVGISGTYIENPSFPETITHGLKQTVSTINQVFYSLKMIFSGKASLNDVGGPVTIIRISGAAAKAGIWNLISFTALMSVQLAVFNLLPFPALDGGWLVILLIEFITKKKVSDRVIQVANFIGFSLLMLLMLLVTIKDILFPISL